VLTVTACGRDKPIGLENVRGQGDAGAEKTSHEAGLPVPSCSDAIALPIAEPVPIELSPTAWFVAPPGAACADTPGALVTQAVMTPTQEIILTGSFVGAANFGSGPLPYLDRDQIFLAAFDGDGGPTWSHALQGTTSAIALDAQGNVAIVRAWVGALNDVGGGGSVDSYSPTGVLRWTRDISFGPTSERRGLAIAASPGDRLSVAVPGRLLTFDATSAQIVQEQDYSYVAPVALGSGAGDTRLLGGIATVAYDPFRVSAFVAALDLAGQDLWRLPITTSDSAGPLQALHAATSSGVAISGAFYDQVTIGAFTLRGEGAAPAGSEATADKSGAFLAKIDSDGVVQWAREGYADKLGAPESLAFDDDGRIIVASTSAADSTVTVSGLDCRGDRSWAQAFSGFPDARVIVVPVQGTTDIVLAGSTATRFDPTCETCCYAPRPYLMRLDHGGTARPAFHAHR
jgi:hypothetical protein